MESYEVCLVVVIVFYLLISGMNLFWVDSNHDVFGRINIGTGVKKTLYSVPKGFFNGMTLVGDKLYITDMYRR
jgi:hypothetical protein